MKLRHAGLARAEHLAGTAHLQVAPRDLETVAGLAQGRQTRPRHFRQRRLVQQHAMALLRAAANAPAQLVQLRQAQPLGILDDHERGVGHVHADLDDGGRHQQLCLAALERRHDFFLFRRLHAPVDQRHLEFGQRFVQGLRRIRCRLQFQCLRFLDQRTDPISLAAGGAGVADAAHDIGAARGGNRHGLDRLAARRQFVNHRYVQIGVEALRQRARNGRGGHDQLMRPARALAALLAQRQPLVHTEAVLLVHHDQSEIGELHAFLKQCLGADGDGGPARTDFFERVLARAAVELAGQPGHGNTQGLEPGGKIPQMLVGQQLGRRHHRDLQSALDSTEGGAGGDDGLARPDVTLHQPLHRMALPQIAQDFFQHALLRARQPERQARQQLLHQFAFIHDGRRRFRLHPCAQAPQAQVMRQQFLEGQAQHGGVFALCQQLHRRVRRRLMHQRQRLGERRQLQLAQHFRRQPLVNFIKMLFQRLARQLAQAQLMQAGGRRIHRGKGFLGLRRLGAINEFVLGMDHLKPDRAEAHLAKQPQAPAAREVLLLDSVEIKKPQMQMTGAVTHATDETAQAAKHHVRQLDLALHRRLHAGPQATDAQQTGAILVTQREMEQDVLHGLQAETRQFFFELWPDTFQRRNRKGGDIRCKCGVRNAECGMGTTAVLFHIPHSAFRIPHLMHSALTTATRSLLLSLFRGLSFQHHDGVHFHRRALGQGGDADGGARRVGLAEILRHHLVHQREVPEVGEIHVELHHVRQTPAGCPGYRA